MDKRSPCVLFTIFLKYRWEQENYIEIWYSEQYFCKTFVSYVNLLTTQWVYEYVCHWLPAFSTSIQNQKRWNSFKIELSCRIKVSKCFTIVWAKNIWTSLVTISSLCSNGYCCVPEISRRNVFFCKKINDWSVHVNNMGSANIRHSDKVALRN